MSDSTFIRKKKSLREFWRMLAFAVLILILVILLYAYAPFSEFWNNLASNFFTIFVAGMSAFFATLVLRRYEPSDAPRAIWTQFAIGLWLWTLAEFIWAGYNMIFGEVRINIADLFWVGAYGFFGHAVYLQYQLMFRPLKRENIILTSVWAAFAFSLTLLIAWALVTFVDEDRGLPLWIASFYPAADLAVGVVALRILLRFRGGALGYPWLGLLVFAIADMLYAVLDLGGFYTWSLESGNLWSMIADVTYTAAYLVVGLGCFAQLLLLKYGPIFKTTRKEIKK
jgi:hypothetical protein